MRVTDLGYVHDNPRLIAMAAWGRALVASRHDDVAATLRWVTAAENTALTGADDVLGVPFLCDMATVLAPSASSTWRRGTWSGPPTAAPSSRTRSRRRRSCSTRRGAARRRGRRVGLHPTAEWWRIR